MDSMPIGFRFHPTDEELVGHYLKHKLLGNDSMVNNVIAEVDVCKIEPWDLPKLSAVKSDDPEWFFLSPRDYKYAKSKRYNRATKCGFWKATGNDRNIKTRGTNNIIGTKKTLVFYKGNVPGVKTNWVIHEYHDATFDESQRTFVLCRLIKKGEEKDEGGNDTLIHDEGEPSRSMGSDHDNQLIGEGISAVGGTLPDMNMESTLQAPQQEDHYFPYSTQEALVGNEHEGSYSNIPFLGAYFRNENNIMHTPFETIEEKDKFLDSFVYFKDENNTMQTLFKITKEEDEFVNSILADLDSSIGEKRGHASVNGPAQSESLRRVYYESIDTDAEIVSALCGNTMSMDTSTIFHEHLSSGEYHASKMSKSSHDDVHGSTSFLSSNNDTNKDRNESIFRDDFFGMESSSCDSTADKPLEINCFEISSSPFHS